jgi:uncharacterized Ntn-hydrolase superfamily protein
MKNLFLLVIGLFSLHFAEAQHTFSIVAVDSVTGEIGSAGATCGDTITWPGSLGAMLISDVIPGTGAIHTQAYYNETNQENAHQQMLDGNSPEEIIDWLVDNDAQNAPAYRQYGVVDFNNGSPRSAGWTGSSCDDYKNHVLGPNYAIQGNILLGQVVLDQMEENFNSIEGPLHEKLMAAMQGANMVGADTRCTVEGTSSLSSFLRVAQPDDSADDLWLELWVGATDEGVDPIDELQDMYDEFFAVGINGFNMDAEVKISPNPVESGMITIEYRGITPDFVKLSNISGVELKARKVRGLKNKLLLDIDDLPKGVFMVMSYKNGVVISTDKVVVR